MSRLLTRRSLYSFAGGSAGALALGVCLLLQSGTFTLRAAQKAGHTGTKLEGYVTAVEPNSISVFDKKNHEIRILTDKDYTSLLGIAAPVTVWYTTEGGANHLEDMVYSGKDQIFVPVNTIGDNIKRIIILPRPEDVDNTEGLIDAMSNYLSANVGWYVAPPELATEIANRAQASSDALKALDPSQPDVDARLYLQAQRLLATTIAQDTRSDAVLEVRIIKVKANVRSYKASWDDMTEPVAGRSSRALTPFGGLGGKGWVYAATADMTLWSQSGKLLWRKRRGFATLGAQSMGAKYRERPLTEVYADSGAMQNWLKGTFSDLTISIHAAAADSAPLSPELQQKLDQAKQAGEEQK